MEALLNQILNWIKYFFENLLELFKQGFYWILSFIWGIIESFIQYLFNIALTTAEFIILSIDYKESLFDASLGWANVPTQVIYILNKCNVDDGILIITSSILIRVTLNLIPTWATRV